jgi:hypothetical protein
MPHSNTPNSTEWRDFDKWQPRSARSYCSDLAMNGLIQKTTAPSGTPSFRVGLHASHFTPEFAVRRMDVVLRARCWANSAARFHVYRKRGGLA